jgi:hypothetical protein
MAARAVGLFVGGEHLDTELTDSQGKFEAHVRLAETDQESIEVRASYSSDAPGRRSAQSQPVAVVLRTAGRFVWLWNLLPVLLCGIALVLVARLMPTQRPKVRPSAATLPPFERGVRQTRRAQHFDLRGRVCRQRDGSPLSQAWVELQHGNTEPTSLSCDARGRFRADQLPAGPLTVRVGAEGYEPIIEEVSIPHRGELSQLTIRLQSLRDRALGHYRAVAVRILPNPDLWPIWTNREVAAGAPVRGRLRARMQALAERVERLYYGARPPSEPEVEDVRVESEQARASLTDEENGTPR